MREARIASALVLSAATLIGGTAASAQERARVFGGVPFGASPAILNEAMTALRLERLPEPEADDPALLDQRFHGQLKGQNVLVTASFDAAGRLEKMLVSFLTIDEECVAFYRSLKNELQRQYGAPATEIERWDFPYANGGHLGQEHFALRIGKGLLATVWNDPDAGSTAGGIVITTTDNVIVQLAYESSSWNAEVARRKKILDESPRPARAVAGGSSALRGE